MAPSGPTDKQPNPPSTDTSSLESATTNPPKWQPNDEKLTVRKIDTTVLPLLLLGLLVLQLDRMNLASALTGGFREAINIDQSTINLGNQIMFIGVIVFEIPLNMLLQRVGPRKWIPAQVLIFGITATMQVFIRDRNGFLVMRAMLGLAEASYIPSSIYTLSTWYRKWELGTRVAVFFFGMFGGNALSVWDLAAGWRERDCWVAVAFPVGGGLDDGGGINFAGGFAWLAGRAAPIVEVEIGCVYRERPLYDPRAARGR
jgi:MFS family permease